MNAATPLLEFRDYSLSFDTFDGSLKVLDRISLRMAPGEALGIVGETGCGKSVTAKSVLGLVPRPPGRVEGGTLSFAGRDLTEADDRIMRQIRGAEVTMVFQDPMTYLNPVFSIGRQLSDVIRAKDRKISKRVAQEQALELLSLVRLPNPAQQLRNYPHQLSGGMRQRVLIAMALAGEPKLLIADEPTTALDVTIQAQILELIQELIQRLGVGLLMISHDLGVVAAVCQRIVVMYAGVIVEDAPVERLFDQPQHPYTQGLLAAIPRLDGSRQTLESIAGSIPNLIEPPTGCRFHPRCPHAETVCRERKPESIPITPNHNVACHLSQCS